MANIQIAENRQLSELLEIALSTQANLNRMLLEKIEAKDKTIELLQIENQQKCNEKLELQQKLDDSEDEKLELQQKLDDSEDEKLELQQKIDSLEDENLELRQRVDPFSPDGLSIEDSFEEEY
jgi:predicted nuclease with TOPRIM domain